MPARKLIQDFAHALDVFLDLEEDREIEPWDRLAPLNLDKPAKGIWSSMPCADNPPKAYLLTVRSQGETKVYDLLWAIDDDPEGWPVVEVTADGDAQVLAANASDWLDGLLFSAGKMGGGIEDDLEDARDEASSDARALADDLLDELDRDLSSAEVLGDRYDEAQETWGDAWMDAVEGIES